MRPSTLGRDAQRGLNLSISSSTKRLNAIAKLRALTAQISPKISSFTPKNIVLFCKKDATIIAQNINGNAKTECLKTISSLMSDKICLNLPIFTPFWGDILHDLR